MSSFKAHATATLCALALSAVSCAYMLYLRVPSVIEIRPELTDAGLRTGLFGGRAEVYLFYHYSEAMVLFTVLFAIAAFNLLFLR